jgi:hypothetical protein
MSRHSFGILGTLGLLILTFWLVGWLFFGMHSARHHLLVPIGTAMILAQIVRRMAHPI